MTRLSLEEQIEAAWFGMTGNLKHYYLGPSGTLHEGRGDGVTVGWYRVGVGLGEFREDVYFVFANMRG